MSILPNKNNPGISHATSLAGEQKICLPIACFLGLNDILCRFHWYSHVGQKAEEPMLNMMDQMASIVGIIADLKDSD